MVHAAVVEVVVLLVALFIVNILYVSGRDYSIYDCIIHR